MRQTFSVVIGLLTHCLVAWGQQGGGEALVSGGRHESFVSNQVATAIAALPPPGKSAYPFRQEQSLSKMVSALFPSSFHAHSGKQRPVSAVQTEGGGEIRAAEAFLVQTNVNGTCYARVKYFEALSADAVRSYVLRFAAETCTVGIPPQNATYDIGDVVLSRIDRSMATNRLAVIVFFNNVAIDLDVSLEGQGVIDADGIIERLKGWALSNPDK